MQYFLQLLALLNVTEKHPVAWEVADLGLNRFACLLSAFA